MPSHTKRSPSSGFTLIELSIVLVIIGLIVGGIIGGKSLINSAEIQKTITDFNSYRVALNNFTLQYDALAGDMRDAEDYFGAANTNNGDGNNHWDDPIVEGLRTWEHLSLAKLVKGTYVGPPLQYDTGVTLPASSYNTRWHALEVTLTSFGNTHYSGKVLKISDGDNNVHWCAGMTVENTVSLEKKMDDGSPVTGNVYAGNPCGSETQCVNSDAYVKSARGMGCQVMFAIE